MIERDGDVMTQVVPNPPAHGAADRASSPVARSTPTSWPPTTDWRPRVTSMRRSTMERGMSRSLLK
jgi:hypothetical protein